MATKRDALNICTHKCNTICPAKFFGGGIIKPKLELLGENNCRKKQNAHCTEGTQKSIIYDTNLNNIQVMETMIYRTQKKFWQHILYSIFKTLTRSLQKKTKNTP
jgi:hypothetical protein